MNMRAQSKPLLMAGQASRCQATWSSSRARRARYGEKRGLGWLWLACAVPAALWGATLEETFDNDPLRNGWKIYGAGEMFSWNSGLNALEVTWDSSRSNSYFHRPIGTILSRDDDFAFAFTVRFQDLAIGTTAGKPYTFQIAVGLLNLQAATSSNFFRGSGLNNSNGPRSIVEFAYFPDSGFGATIAPTVVSTNNRFAFAHHYPLELTPHNTFRVLMTYSATNRTLHTAVTRNGEMFGLPPDNQLPPLAFGDLPDFRVDTFSISSYSDAGQNPPQFSGSILAHGVVDDLLYSGPEPPAMNMKWLTGNRSLQFTGKPGWTYLLERTTNLSVWTPASSVTVATNDVTTLADTNVVVSTAFYRLRINRP